MINIDEVNFSPKVLNWRTWLKTGTNWEVFSQKYSVAISLIWAISSDGKYIAVALNNRLNSNTFIEFLKIIEHWINEYHQDYYRKVLILLDNWSIHRSKQSKDYMRKADSRFIFLPHYSPSLAPIELIFAKIKNSIANTNTNEITDWKPSKGICAISQSLNLIDFWEIMRCWVHWLNVSEKYIDSFKNHLVNLKSIN